MNNSFSTLESVFSFCSGCLFATDCQLAVTNINDHHRTQIERASGGQTVDNKLNTCFWYVSVPV